MALALAPNSEPAQVALDAMPCDRQALEAEVLATYEPGEALSHHWTVSAAFGGFHPALAVQVEGAVISHIFCPGGAAAWERQAQCLIEQPSVEQSRGAAEARVA